MRYRPAVPASPTIRTYTRRSLLGSSAALAAGAALACGGGGAKPSPTPPPGSPSTSSAPATATATIPASPTPLSRVRTGGTVRIPAAQAFSFDTFDALRSGDVSTLEVLARTHSRLVQWAEPEAMRIGPDLAARWEQPDAQTIVLRLDPAARWHDLPPLNGRPLTASDVVAHLDRARQLAKTVRLPAVQRGHDPASIDSVSAPTAASVRIRTTAPDPFILQTLAARFALVQAPEAVEAFADRWPKLDLASIVGTGPFIAAPFDSENRLPLRANTAGHRVPLVDGLLVSYPASDPSDLRSRAVDAYLATDRRDVVTLKAELAAGLRQQPRYESQGVLSTMFVGAPPWSDARLRRALSVALNRPRLSRELFGGRSKPSTAVPPVFAAAPPESALASRPGFRTDAAADAAEARALWEAGGGPALGTVTIDFPSVFDPLYSASSVVTAILNEALGPQFRAAVETYTTISKKAVERRYGGGNAALWFGWGPPLVEPDPSRWLVETYRSGLPSADGAGFKDREVDARLDALRREPSLETRSAIVREIAGLLDAAGGGGVIDWLQQRFELLSWPYLQRPVHTSWWAHHLDADASLDRTAPGFNERP